MDARRILQIPREQLLRLRVHISATVFAAASVATPVAAVATLAAVAASLAAVAAPLAAASIVAAASTLAATRLHYGREGCPLSRRRVRHRQRSPVPSVDKPNAAHAHIHAHRQSEQRIGGPQLLSQPGRRTRALVLYDGSFKALGALQSDPRVSAFAATIAALAALAALSALAALAALYPGHVH